jgi:hypothetical protein
MFTKVYILLFSGSDVLVLSGEAEFRKSGCELPHQVVSLRHRALYFQ